MPYIPQADRDKFSHPLSILAQTISQYGISGGELNYLMTQVALMYLYKHKESYNTIGDVIKAFECAKLEFARRKMEPYEDSKKRTNGDVY